jgi:hypothetical protein
LGKRRRGLRVDDSQHLTAEDSPDDQAVTVDGDDPVSLVED